MALTFLVTTYHFGRCHGRLSSISILLRHLLRRRPRHLDRRRIPLPPIDCWVSARIRRHSLARLGPRSLRPSSFHPSSASPAPPTSCPPLPPRPPSTPQEERSLSRSTLMQRDSAHSSPTMARVRRIGGPYLRRFFSGNSPPPIDCCVSPSPFDATRPPPTMARVHRLFCRSLHRFISCLHRRPFQRCIFVHRRTFRRCCVMHRQTSRRCLFVHLRLPPFDC